MTRQLSRWLPLLLLLPLIAQAVVYRAPMNHAEWRLELSKFECRMWQPIPVYGDAVFQHRAGEKQRFYLSPTRPLMREGKASLVSVPPVWNSELNSADLGYVPVKNGQQPVTLPSDLSMRLLTELYNGMSPVFTRQAWYSEGEHVQVALSSVNFRKAYSQYRDCLSQLLPVNFDQIARTRVHFKTGRWELTSTSQQRLEMLLEYVKADPSVTAFFVDGHTDNVGKRLYNLDLSKRRAEEVAKYLKAAGIDESLITTRYHGERYPVASNRSASERAQNRRVTIRLERDSL
jgi:outer membrane protein OmpA-like peptidoglycan-associated protein